MTKKEWQIIKDKAEKQKQDDQMILRVIGLVVLFFIIFVALGILL